ncbi:methionine--tRNA ligase [Patescibacteria group bacterium]|nr:methionine--tRNA ligase [Patescibacteria group bacterium]
MNKLITTAIDYVNGSPHLGHALEKIYADVYARHLRRKNKVYFLTGTDENSLKTVRTAEQEGVLPEEIASKNSLRFYEMKELLGLSYNDFIRTTEKRHFLGAQKLWKACEKDIYKKNYKGLYCVGCEEYFKEEELIDGCCPIHKTRLEEIEEENYFFRLSKYEDKILQIIENNEVEIIPKQRKNEMLSFIKSGLQDFCISRTSKRARGWGIDVPLDSSQKMWVWFDALSNYITALGYFNNEKNFNEFWEKGETTHIIGKDILRFHAIYWIAMLLSAGLKLPSKIMTHGFITVNNQKMSKSIGNVIDPFELVLKYGKDPVRYFLLSEFKPTGDGDFSYEKFEKKYNADLSSGIGNLVSRILTLIVKKDLIGEEIIYFNEYEDYILKCNKHLEAFEFNEALALIWKMQKELDGYIEERKPWEITDKRELVLIFSKLVLALRKIAFMLEPFLPETSEKILKFLGEDKTKINVLSREMLFPRIKYD